jgi:hypothetical protein
MKQIAAYVRPELASVAYDRASCLAKTNQEVVADAISAALLGMGYKSPLECEHKKIIRRSYLARARKKKRAQVTLSRGGNVFIGGWFSNDSVRELLSIARTVGVSVQDLVVLGLKKFKAEKDAGMEG